MKLNNVIVLIVMRLLIDIKIVMTLDCNSHLITDLSQDSCIEKAHDDLTYFYWIDTKKSCIPYCEQYPTDSDNDNIIVTRCESTEQCPPGYECNKRCNTIKNKTPQLCNEDKDCPDSIRNRCRQFCMSSHDKYAALSSSNPICMAYHANIKPYANTYYKALKFKPKCTNSGDWKPKQCKGGLSGRCMCYGAKGKRLFGQAEYLKSEDMTCSCSRRRADLMAAGRHYVTFHCDSKGNYEELQCDKDTKLCWCVDAKTGELKSPVVPEKAMIKLPCYKVAAVGGQYLRKCDSVLYAISQIESKLKIHGMQYVNFGNIQCDGDGAYGAYNLSAQIARCTWRDGKQISPWQSDASTDISKLDCNCARDFKMYNHPLTCDGAGNYIPLQSVVNKDKTNYFCVDSDGFPKTDLSDQKINCDSYY